MEIGKQGCLGYNTQVALSTVKNYKTTIAIVRPDVTIATSYLKKTNNRYTAEQSLRSTMAYLLTMCQTHYIPANQLEVKKKRVVSEGALKLKDMVEDVLGCHTMTVKPQYIYSTDDTVQYVFEGSAEK